VVLDVAKLLSTPESELHEFKREWYDLEARSGKAEFVKDVLCLANTVREGERAHVVIGRDDDRHGGTVHGVTDPPDAEKLHQILASYTDPVPQIRLQSASDPDTGKRISVLTVEWSQFQPHFSVREYPEVLSDKFGYVRRGPTNGVLKASELSHLIRQKTTRVGPATAAAPIRAGFVEGPGSGSLTVVVQVSNISAEPVDAVSAVLDVRLQVPPHAMSRTRSLTNTTLAPGETRETEYKLRTLLYSTGDDAWRSEAKASHDWLDLTLKVTYRARNGLLREIREHLSVG
jgi:Schlafen, AlbA_2